MAVVSLGRILISVILVGGITTLIATRAPSRRPSTRRPTSPSRSPTKRPLSEAPTSTKRPQYRPTMKPTLSPTTSIPPYMEYREWSSFLFLGDFTFAEWACFNAGSEPLPTSNPTTSACLHFMTNYFNNPARIPVDCSRLSNSYCNSAFQSEFPGAISLAETVTRIEDITDFITTSTAISHLVNGVSNVKITRVVVQGGSYNAQLLYPSSQFLSLYKALLNAIHDKFPNAEILLLTINPVRFVNGEPPTIIRQVNDMIDRTFRDNSEFPYVKVGDTRPFFYTNTGAINSLAYSDFVKLSATGYSLFANAVKSAVTENYPIDLNWKNFLFLGDSLIQYWLCFKDGEQAVPQQNTDCVFYMFSYWTDETINGDCSGVSNLYCDSKFQQDFPGALNFGRTSFSLQRITDYVLSYPQLQDVTRLSGENAIKYIVVDGGVINIPTYIPPAEFIPLYYNLFDAIHLRFPNAEIVFLGILPSNLFPTTYLAQTRAAVIELIKSNITSNARYPFVHFCDLTRYFLINGYLANSTLFGDTIHLSSAGYEVFAKNLKIFILKTLFPYE